MLTTIEQTQAPVLDYSDKPLILELSKVKLDPRLDIRCLRKTPVITEYANNYRDLDKGSVMLIGKEYHLVDGWYRYLAAKKFGIFSDDFIDLGKGTFREALKLAVEANLKHGERLTREDKVKIAAMIEAEHKDDKTWTRTKTALVMGIKPQRVSDLLNFPDGRLEEKKLNPKRKRLADHPINQGIYRVQVQFELAKIAMAKLEKDFPMRVWPQDQKERFAKILAPWKKHWERMS